MAEVGDEDELCFLDWWGGDEVDVKRIKRRIAHPTREAAEAHARALILASGGEV